MILCTLGTHPQPFGRALDWVLGAVGEEAVVVQHGATPPRPQAGPRIEWHESLSYDELTRRMREADVVVGHAGVGTLMTAIELGHKPVAIPRLRRCGEHVDDHQLDIAREMDRAGYVAGCFSPQELSAALDAARSADSDARAPTGDLRRVAIVAAGGNPGRKPKGSSGR